MNISETDLKWLRRVSKIFFASLMSICYHEVHQTVNVMPAKAKNI